VFRVVNHKHHVPTYSIILQAAIAIVLVLTATFYKILIYIVFLISIFDSLTVLGFMLLIFKKHDHTRPYKTWGYPLTPIIFISVNLWIVIFSIRQNITVFCWGLATVAVGWVFYEFFERRLNRHSEKTEHKCG
jgi:APA family basic amino acid/polyamine antiporter